MKLTPYICICWLFHRILNVEFSGNSCSHIYFTTVNQRDVTVRSQFYFILMQDYSTSFGCYPHPSSGVHKIVTTVSGTCHISLQLTSSNVAKLTTLEEGSCNDI